MLRLFALTVAVRLAVFLLASFSASFLPLFDSSGASNPYLRWDAIHFQHIAQAGYVYEHEWAFLSGLPFLLRILPTPVFQLLSVAVDLGTTHALYYLSLEMLGEKIATLTTLLSLLPSSPATLRLAPYNEPFFIFLSYRGMLHCQRKQFVAATVLFTLAGFFRSNSVLLAGFILWGMIVAPFLANTPIRLSAILYVAPIFLPFLAHNAAAYMAFCTSADRPEWCARVVPSIYSHVQKTYWNVGFLNYYTPEQIPNFLIAAPPVLLLYSFCIWHLRRPRSPSPFLSHALTPHVLHALFLTTTVVLSAHVQIMLRFAASMPLVYWAAAWLLLYYPRLGYTWIAWSITWGVISVVLWSTFLPPA
ncbi:GPI mannosyltransferase 2 [Mucidula mucida]|nr:GPI mannosyltransferase 2 [Mucidula mucida]